MVMSELLSESLKYVLGNTVNKNNHQHVESQKVCITADLMGSFWQRRGSFKCQHRG